MNHSILLRVDPFVVGMFLFFAMILMVLLGKIAGRKWNKEGIEPKGGMNSLFTALFALSGLILAFTFGMSQSRLERVRAVVEDEVNDIGTAVLRSDLYTDSIREGFRNDFRKYAEAVIAYYDNAGNAHVMQQSKGDATKAGEGLWARATQQSKLPNMLIPSNLMIPALNDMFDIAQTREIVLNSRVPDLVEWMLFVCVLVTCFIGGFTSSAFAGREWIIIIGFAIVTSMVVYTTIDLSRPFSGMIRVDAGQQAIVELRKMF